MDLVTTVGSLRRVALLSGDGTGAFTVTNFPTRPGSNPASIALADVNRDGIPDVVVGDAASTGGIILFGQ